MVQMQRPLELEPIVQSLSIASFVKRMRLMYNSLMFLNGKSIARRKNLLAFCFLHHSFPALSYEEERFLNNEKIPQVVGTYLRFLFQHVSTSKGLFRFLMISLEKCISVCFFTASFLLSLFCNQHGPQNHKSEGKTALYVMQMFTCCVNFIYP